MEKATKADITKAVHKELVENKRIKECPTKMIQHIEKVNEDTAYPIIDELMKKSRIQETLDNMHGVLKERDQDNRLLDGNRFISQYRRQDDDSPIGRIEKRVEKLIELGYPSKMPLEFMKVFPTLKME